MRRAGDHGRDRDATGGDRPRGAGRAGRGQGRGRGDGRWRKIGSDVMGEYRTFRVRRDLVRLPRSGDLVDYYVLDLDDWVNVVPVTDDGRLVLVEQYRPGSGDAALEFPAGVMESSEDPCEAGARELREETGYRAGACELLGAVDANPAIQTNRLNIVLATGCSDTGERDEDRTEDVAVRLVAPGDVPDLIAGGRIRHALAVTTWWWYRKRVDG